MLAATKEEFVNTNILNYDRTKEELSAPFQDASTQVYRSGLRLVSIDYRISDCPFHDIWMREGKTGM